MKISRWNRIVLNVKDDYVILMAKSPITGFDPTGTYWGLAQGYRVVSDLSTNTLVLVPIGQPSRVRVSDFRPEDLETE